MFAASTLVIRSRTPSVNLFRTTTIFLLQYSPKAHRLLLILILESQSGQRFNCQRWGKSLNADFKAPLRLGHPIEPATQSSQPSGRATPKLIKPCGYLLRPRNHILKWCRRAEADNSNYRKAFAHSLCAMSFIYLTVLLCLIGAVCSKPAPRPIPQNTPTTTGVATPQPTICGDIIDEVNEGMLRTGRLAEATTE